MKYHKIAGIEKSVCTAEQKIAYNMSFRAHISYQDKFDKAKKISAACVSALLADIVRDMMKQYRWSYNYKPEKYDEDAIFCALNAGIEKYLEKPFVTDDYAVVGAAFPARFL